MPKATRPRSASQVYATADPETGLLDITGTAANPEQAVAVSTAYSHALITYLDRLKQKKITLQQQVVERQIQILQRQGSGPDLIASLRSTLSQLALDRTTPIPLAIYQPATAVRAAPNAVQASSGIQVPKSLPLRIALAALLGLLAGVVLALVLERFDTRIRSPRAAEEAFGLPVLAEVPAISRGRRGTIVTASHPSSRAADAFRLVGVGTARWTSNTNGNGSGPARRKPSSSPVRRRVTARPPSPPTSRWPTPRPGAGSWSCRAICGGRPSMRSSASTSSPASPTLLERTNGDADSASEPRSRYLPRALFRGPCRRDPERRGVGASGRAARFGEDATVPRALEEDHRRHHPGLRAARGGERRGASPSPSRWGHHRRARAQDPTGARRKHRRAPGAYGRSHGRRRAERRQGVLDPVGEAAHVSADEKDAEGRQARWPTPDGGALDACPLRRARSGGRATPRSSRTRRWSSEHSSGRGRAGGRGGRT